MRELTQAGASKKSRYSSGVYKQFKAVFIDDVMREALYCLPDLGDDVTAADDTWHMIGRINNMNMYAVLAPVAAAGGATMPVAIMLYMAGSGIAGDKADAISFAHAYLHAVRMDLYKERAAAHADYLRTGAGRGLAPHPPQPVHPPLPLSTVQTVRQRCVVILVPLQRPQKTRRVD